jgi:hypothetical protein
MFVRRRREGLGREVPGLPSSRNLHPPAPFLLPGHNPPWQEEGESPEPLSLAAIFVRRRREGLGREVPGLPSSRNLHPPAPSSSQGTIIPGKRKGRWRDLSTKSSSPRTRASPFAVLPQPFGPTDFAETRRRHGRSRQAQRTAPMSGAPLRLSPYSLLLTPHPLQPYSLHSMRKRHLSPQKNPKQHQHEDRDEHQNHR